MPDLTVPVPENANVTATQVLAGCARATGWTPESPLTVPQHVVRYLRRELVRRYRQDLIQQAVEAATADLKEPE